MWLLGSGTKNCSKSMVAVRSGSLAPFWPEGRHVELATFCCACLTGERMLQRARFAAGETVLVTGASGGVGSYPALSRPRRCADRSDGSRQRTGNARYRRGAVVTRRGRDLVDAVRKSANGLPVDDVADLVGGVILSGLLKVLGPKADIPQRAPSPGPVVQLDPLET